MYGRSVARHPLPRRALDAWLSPNFPQRLLSGGPGGSPRGGAEQPAWRAGDFADVIEGQRGRGEGLLQALGLVGDRGHRRASDNPGAVHKYEYQVIVISSHAPADEPIEFRQGRGAQEKLFGEAKQHAALDGVATKRLVANRMVTCAGMLTQNLGRELQMRTRSPEHPAPIRNRTARWRFQTPGTIANTITHPAGRFVRPNGRLTLHLIATNAPSPTSGPSSTPCSHQSERHRITGLRLTLLLI